MTLWLSIHIVSFVYVTVGKVLDAEPMLQTIVELSLVAIAIDPNVNSVTIWAALLPLTVVRVPLAPAPLSLPMFHPVEPLSYVTLSVGPNELAIAWGRRIDTFWFSVYIHPIVDGF